MWRLIDNSIDFDGDIDEAINNVVSEKIEEVIGGAGEQYDTLGEVADHIENIKDTLDDVVVGGGG